MLVAVDVQVQLTFGESLATVCLADRERWHSLAKENTLGKIFFSPSSALDAKSPPYMHGHTMNVPGKPR